ncbi:MAG: DUF6017 domain-containing protein [Clostridiales bacterium]|nr:DUF6017 domain-containing protein [Clostridiales bacterium]
MKIRVEKTHNYTVMSNYHIFDKRLSFKAKGLLSFMLSVPDTWEYSVKGLAAMAKDGVDSVSTALKEIERYGYVSRKQIRSENGNFKEVEYTIYEKPLNGFENNNVSSENEHCEPKRNNPEQAESCQTKGTQPVREKPVSDKSEHKKRKKKKSLSETPIQDAPSSEEPISDNPMSENPVSENPAQINTNKSKVLTEVNINPIISYQKNNDNDTIGEDYQTYEEIIKDNICYENTVKAQCSDKEMEQVDFMVQLMAETMVSTAPTVRIGKNDLPIELVRSRFMKIWYEDIFAVLKGVKEAKTKITYYKNYYLTALYYADHTENIKVQQIFKNDYEAEMPVNKLKTDGLGSKVVDDTTLELLLREMEEQDE